MKIHPPGTPVCQQEGARLSMGHTIRAPPSSLVRLLLVYRRKDHM